MTQPASSLSLVADVGGTNTRVALADGARLLTDTVEKVPNRQADSLAALLEAYVADRSVDCAAAAVAIAGPVHNGRGTLTNLDWSMDCDTLATISKAETVAVLNDLQAQAYALGRIADENLRPILPGQQADPVAARLVIGIGTGFNAALALSTGQSRVVPASECGHVTMPVRNAADLRLVQFIERATGFASVEDVQSGRGVENIHAWHLHEAGDDTRHSAADIMAAADQGDEMALKTVETFVQLMGRVAGDLALVHLPFGGIHYIGGVARAMTPYLDRFDFARHFHDKGRFSDFMARFPVKLVEDDFAALAGLSAHLDALRKSRNS